MHIVIHTEAEQMSSCFNFSFNQTTDMTNENHSLNVNDEFHLGQNL
jgi:hypothetical protein